MIRHEGNATHDEQHGTGVLGDFETFIFHHITAFITLQSYKKIPTYPNFPGTILY